MTATPTSARTRARGGRTTPRSLERKLQRPGLYFAAPALVLFALFFAYPLGSSFWQSMTKTVGGQTAFVGLDQYIRLFSDPLIGKSLFNAGILLVVQVPLMMCLAVALAYMLNQNWLKFTDGFRVLHFLPAVTTLVAYSVVFRVMLATDGGAVNQIIGLVGIAPVDWLNSETWARVALIASITWRWTGYNMVIILAGLQAIPGELYEAARMDGAGRWAIFSKIVIPQLRPVLLFTGITSTIGALQLFDENFILTGGGPSDATLTPVLYLYKVGFRQFDFGYASAIGWMIVAITAVIALIQFRLSKEKP